MFLFLTAAMKRKKNYEKEKWDPECKSSSLPLIGKIVLHLYKDDVCEKVLEFLYNCFSFLSKGR